MLFFWRVNKHGKGLVMVDVNSIVLPFPIPSVLKFLPSIAASCPPVEEYLMARWYIFLPVQFLIFLLWYPLILLFSLFFFLASIMLIITPALNRVLHFFVAIFTIRVSHHLVNRSRTFSHGILTCKLMFLGTK